MPLRPGRFEMTALLAAMTALGSISNDTYLPSLPAISRDLSASAASVQLTLSAFLVGFAVGQAFYGPFSDRYGRRPALIAGFALFLVATGFCASAHTIGVLIFARVVQSIGASGPIILARAVVRDLYEGPRATRELSAMAAIMGVSPVLAPVIGGVLQAHFDWRASFLLVEALGLAIGGVAFAFLPETARSKGAHALSLASVGRSYAIVWSRASFRAYAALLTFAYAGLFAYVSASSFVLQDIYGLTAIGFSLAFAACSITFVLGSFAAGRLPVRRGLDGVIGLGVTAVAAGGVAQLALCWWRPELLVSVLAPEMIVTAGVGLAMPHLLAAAMAPFPERAGAASSLLGVIQMSGAAVVGVALGASLDRSPLPFAVTTASMGLGALAIYVLSAPVRRAGHASASSAPASLSRSSSRESL